MALVQNICVMGIQQRQQQVAAIKLIKVALAIACKFKIKAEEIMKEGQNALPRLLIRQTQERSKKMYTGYDEAFIPRTSKPKELQVCP